MCRSTQARRISARMNRTIIFPFRWSCPDRRFPFVQAKDQDKATIDIIGEVRLSGGGKVPLGQLRDTVKLALESSQQVRRKNLQYNTGFVLAPGNYHLKFTVRENQTGRMGSFETDVQIPDLRKVPLRMSSVVLSSLRAPVTRASKKKNVDPLIQDQTQLVPNRDACVYARPAFVFAVRNL